MILAFLLASIQWYLVVGIFDYLYFTRTTIPNLLEDVAGRPLVDWFVWLNYGAFVVVVPLYFRIRGKGTLNTRAIWAFAIGANGITMISWYLLESGQIALTSGIMIMILTTFLNTIWVAVLYILLIHVLFPEN